MPFWSRLFGSKPAEADGPGSSPAGGEDYKGFRITPAPIREAGGFRVAARIEREIAGVTRRHELQRADVASTRDEAVALSLRKARQVIDEQGERLFG
jgi:hypothetical protein